MPVTIIPRSEWTSIPNTAPRVDKPYNECVIHTEAGAVLEKDWPAITEAAKVLSLTERQHMAAIDRYHRVNRGWANGFGYNFLIERDGTIIEGRGWGRVGGHTQQGRNYTAFAICFAGHGDLQPATEAQWISARELIAEGIRLGEVVPNPVISGHRNYAQKSCPGNKVYPHIGRLRGIHGPVVNPRPTPTPEENPLMAPALSSTVQKEVRTIVKQEMILLADAVFKHIDRRFMEQQGRADAEDKADDAEIAQLRKELEAHVRS